ncbi:hypothetical protein SAMN04488515_3089 [Cognatiyoonia koreensis]|uniref:Tetratricopeptide repeat-containing protein n=1 Tax=Cognatiyoonia koreensis TaxID=364200 RepID=A0A1I0RQC9_9RHOB|nr:hypothetical protein [Cognatiyoonia koreensis]SEW43510.1 hypothetical protein SAMN04488515_3089 [Cognatiyoonia koreensis]
MAQDRYGYVVNRARNYGYCHASGEAVQQARFMLGLQTPPEELWPLIARNADFGVLAGQAHDLSDLYVVELSSAKRITVDGFFVQLNYLAHAYPDVFGDQSIARAFWDCAADGDQSLIDAFLEARDLSDEDFALLRRLRMEFTTPEHLRADIKALQDLLPRTLFVTHVDARQADGVPIASRSSYIADVKDAARKTGARVYDPTALMLSFGQKDAIADDSTGLAHFSDDFAKALVADWMTVAIAPAVRDVVRHAAPDRAADVFLPYAQNCLAHGDLLEVGDKLDDLIRSRPDVPRLETVRDLLSTARADTAEAYAAETGSALSAVRKKAALALQLGRFDAVADHVAKGGFGSVFALRKIVEIAAKFGTAAAALQILKAAWEAKPNNSDIAHDLAQRLLDERPEMLTDLAPQAKETLLRHIGPLLQLKLCHAAGVACAVDTAVASAEEIVAIAAHLTVVDDIAGAARAVRDWRTAQTDAGPLPADLHPMFDRWSAAVDTVKDREVALSILADILFLVPQHRPARTALRDLRRKLRLEIRAAFDAEDLPMLDSFVAANTALPDPLHELGLYRARLCFAAGDDAAAIRIGDQVATDLPDNISVRVLLMRAAMRSGDLVTAIGAAEQVCALSDDKTARLRIEANRLLDQCRSLPREGASKLTLVRFQSKRVVA